MNAIPAFSAQARRPAPAAWTPAHLARRPAPRMGQAAPAAAAGMVLLGTAASVATSYVGFRLGSLDRGFPSVLGYVVGAVGALQTLVGLLGLVGVSMAGNRA